MQPFIVPLNDLAPGRTHFRWQAEGQFFSAFENSEILDAELVVCAEVEKCGHRITVDLDIDGTVVVACDRCLAELSIPVSVSRAFSVVSGESQADDTPEDDDGCEVIILPDSDTDLDLSQVVYDYVCISLPLSRVHADGGCDPETVRYLAGDGSDEGPAAPAESPFAALKDLLESK